MDDWTTLTKPDKKIVKYDTARQEGYITIDEVVNKTGLSETQTRRILKKAVNDGKVLKVFCNGTCCQIAMYKML
jgi:Fic family protein